MTCAGQLLATVLALGGLAVNALAAESPPAAPPSPPVAPSPSQPPASGAAKSALASSAAVTSASEPPPPPGAIHEAAPRPEAAIRVQQRFALKAKLVEIAAGGEYLSRGDFYNSPGLRISGAYYPLEQLGLEARISHYWSSLDATAQEVISLNGLLPDSHPPEWVGMLGVRYSIGYGKLMVGGLGGVVHFEPQAFVHGGIHYSGSFMGNGSSFGPSADFGLGFLVFLMPRLFARIDVPVTLDWEYRYSRTVTVFGAAPALSVGGFLGGT